jgi:hypothetical protein
MEKRTVVRFDPRNRTAPRVAEAEMEPERIEEIAEETDEGSIISGENEEHF